jgi:hypothetical protein
VNPRKRKRTPSQVEDFFGVLWDVSESRATAHGFEVFLGRPANLKGVRSAGRSHVILTPPLVRYFARLRMQPGQANLPIGLSAISKLRAQLGFHIEKDIRCWWESRKNDLATLSGTEFAAKHGKSPHAALYTHRILFGNRIKPRFWWKAADAQALLFSGEPDAKIAAKLGIAESSVRRLRSQARRG